MEKSCRGQAENLNGNFRFYMGNRKKERSHVREGRKVCRIKEKKYYCNISLLDTLQPPQ